MASAFCMCELGGVWLQAKNFVPVLVPPLEFRDLKAVLAGLQGLKIESDADLDQLRDTVSAATSIVALSTPRWNQRRDAFLQSLPGILKQLPDETPVPRTIYNYTIADLEKIKSEYSRCQTEASRLQAVNEDLRKLKDTRESEKILRQHSSSEEVFTSLARSVKEALLPLPYAVMEALYYSVRGEYYTPGEDQLEAAKRSVEDGQLEQLFGNEFQPCTSDPKVRRAKAALDALDKWLHEAPADFSDWYDTGFDAVPNIRLRPFWSNHFR